ncbi:hypothetical protein BH09BAC5_BH09BAC5_14660 [soil metagenome]
MKKYVLITFIFSSLFCLVNAQQDSTKAKKWQIGLNVNTVEPVSDAGFDYNALSQRIFVNGHRIDNSICLGLNLSYYPTKDFHVRLSGKMTNYSVRESRDFREFYSGPNQIPDYAIDSLKIHEGVLTISSGLLWDFNYKRITFQAGLQLSFKKYGTISGTTIFSDWDAQTNIPTSYQIIYQKEKGGFSIGIGPVAGFSVNILKQIAIGAEFYSSFSYYKTGGRIISNGTNVLTQYHGVETWITQDYRGCNFSKINSALTLSVLF